MGFSDTQLRLLAGKLNEKHVRTREDKGHTLSYIEGWHAIDEANRVFGFDGWDRETVWAECVWSDGRSHPKACAYAVRVRIRVRAGEALICRDGSGVGHGAGSTLGEAHERALKEAETDATKRALTTFGNLFGLALYDKAQNGVRKARNGNGNGRPVSWTVLGPEGELRSRQDSPEGFCGGVREAIEAAGTEVELEAVWARNSWGVNQLRTYFPELKTAQGAHYADLLERLYKDKARVLRREASQSPTEAERAIEKAELAISEPRRLRDADHRRFVASQPCLICGRSPSHAHHLRFAQPRSMGSKVSDEFTVPLCALHHRALHDDGPEEKWWQERGIEPLKEAERLWREGHSASEMTGVGAAAEVSGLKASAK